MKSIIIIFLTLICYTVSEKFRFDNYTLYKIIPKNAYQIKLLHDLEQTNYNYDFWNGISQAINFVDVMSAPGHKADLENFLERNSIPYEIAIPNIQDAVEKEKVKEYTRNNIKSMTWDAYYNLQNIYDWLEDLAAIYPNILTVIVGGVSYEQRQIKGVKLSHGSGKRAVFLEGGMHAREWISPSTVCYILNELLTSSDGDTIEAARDFDWYVFPVANPDGYIWSHESFRMWRKNRRPIGEAIGVDLNRNWNNNWLLKGASTNASSDIYAGPGPFSEIETRSFSAFIRTIGDDIDLYLSFHSFSQMLLIPFGNTTEPVANYHDALNIGRRAMGALSVRYGTQYVTGNIAEVIYEATGGSVDWVKDHLRVPLVYCYELRDRGLNGFLLPTEEILPNNQEAMDSVLDLIYQARRFGYMDSSRRNIM